MSHTPGLWVAHESGGGVFVDVRDHNGNVICEMVGIGEPGKIANTTNANAILIAAAPELLAVLKEMESSKGGCFCDFDSSQHTDYPASAHAGFCIRAAAVITKAEGQ